MGGRVDKVRNNTMGQGVKAWVDQLSTSMLLAGVKAEITNLNSFKSSSKLQFKHLLNREMFPSF